MAAVGALREPAPAARRPLEDHTLNHTTVAPQQHAAHSRDALRLPGAPPLTTVEGRRWRDLHLFYARQLGDRVNREDMRLLLGSLISHTLMLEQLQATVARGDPVEPNNLIQGTQTVFRLLSELGLKQGPAPEAPPTPLEYAKRTVEAAE